MAALVIGFGHKARQGKDFAAQAIIDRFGGEYDIRRYSFATALKCEVYDAMRCALDPFWDFAATRWFNFFDLPHDFTGPALPSDEEKVAWVESVRNRPNVLRMLQIFGTDYRRKQDPMYWVRKLARRIQTEKPQVALITDMRLANEYYLVKAAKPGYTVKVARTGFVDPNRDSSHISETALTSFHFDFEIEVADGAVAELRSDAVSVFERILEAEAGSWDVPVTAPAE